MAKNHIEAAALKRQRENYDLAVALTRNHGRDFVALWGFTPEIIASMKAA